MHAPIFGILATKWLIGTYLGDMIYFGLSEQSDGILVQRPGRNAEGTESEEKKKETLRILCASSG
jgi:hypothetical protein